jgi:hypothetical protein
MQALFNPDTLARAIRLDLARIRRFCLCHSLRLAGEYMLCLVDGLEGRKNLDLISARYESIETGQEVTLRFTPPLSRLGVAS